MVFWAFSAWGLGGINGQVAMSALGSGCVCPTAFMAYCLDGASSAFRFSVVFQPRPSLNELGGGGVGR